MSERGRAAWSDALEAARLLAADPHGLGGIRLRAAPGPVRDAWLAALRAGLAPGAPLRRLPLSISDDRLLGGLDLAATLAAGRPVAQAGLLAEADGGLVVVPMAERLGAGTAARLAAALDSGRAGDRPARFGLVLLDEGEGDERAPAALADRLAFDVDLTEVGVRQMDESSGAEADAGAEPDPASRLCEVAVALGIASLRAPILALRAARLAARRAGRGAVSEADLVLAARLVLAPRATRLPEPATPPEAAEPPPQTGDGAEEGASEARALEDVVLEAARAAIPPNLLAQLTAGAARQAAGGRAGAESASLRVGRPAGTRAGDPRRGRLALVETLRAAAPWQRLRGRRDRILIRADDLRITRFRRRSETTTIFAVDASGSAALERLAEAKGAVELLLAEAYVRRDRVALVAFRGAGADLVLPPTRSLVRAKRGLAALPGGGGTPLAAGLDAALALALGVRRSGGSPVVVLLTDGRANVARSGEPGRAQAAADALGAARALRAAGLGALLVDTAARPQEAARHLAEAMGARYLALPRADAGSLSAAVRAAGPAA
ncbi:magnesium chelatase subunit D [Methylobacterium sp. A54F]